MFKVQKVAKHFIFKILMFTKLIRMKCNAVNRIQIHTFFLLYLIYVHSRPVALKPSLRTLFKEMCS